MILMKLVKYNEGRLGALVDDSVIDLNYAFAAYKKSKGAANPQRKADAKVPSCLLAFIKEGDAGLEKAKKALEHVKAGACCGPKGQKLVYKKGEYKLKAPLPSNGTKIAMAGANFYDHSIDAYKMIRGDTTTLEELAALSPPERLRALSINEFPLEALPMELIDKEKLEELSSEELRKLFSRIDQRRGKWGSVAKFISGILERR